MSRADLTAPRRTRYLVMALVALVHVVLLLGLIRAFAPDLASQATAAVLSSFNVADLPPAPPPAEQAQSAGAASQEGKKAVPREEKLAKPEIAFANPVPAPPVAARGSENSAGARDAGAGSGAGGQGSGTGSGAGGNGQGGGAASRFVQIAGTIDAARDYPRETRDLRIGKEVVIVFTVGTDGRVHNCRVRSPSGDSQSDTITCRLAEQRFRFRPSTDANGDPIEAQYGWRQRWFYRGRNN